MRHKMMLLYNRGWVFWTGIVLLVLPGLAHAYLLMPFPGSQDLNAITLSYYLEQIIAPLRVIGSVFVLWYLVIYFFKRNTRHKMLKGSILLLCMVSFYFTDDMYSAQQMFHEPDHKQFANLMNNKVPGSYVVLGVVENGIAKAYPLIYLGYHHKVQDDVGGMPVLVTYCTMCRAGRVYNPVINGKRQTFRLVGARHFNAIIEDEDTRSWWYQATGYAAVGPLKGTQLKENNYKQSTLDTWLKKHPASLILQPDGNYLDDYRDLSNYDRLQAVDKDTSSKKKDNLVRKSWILGVIVNKQEKAYDWRQLSKIRVLNDSFCNTPLLMVIEGDSLTYHALNRTMGGRTLNFQINTAGQLTDQETASVWNLDGECIAGAQKGRQLPKLQAYQEYWHSWKHFHPATQFWNGDSLKNSLADNN